MKKIITDKLLNFSQFSKLHRLSRPTTDYLIRQGLLPTTMISRRLFIDTTSENVIRNALKTCTGRGNWRRPRSYYY
jgi:hypothetical protein